MVDFLSGDVTRYTMVLCRHGSVRKVKKKYPHLALRSLTKFESIDDGVWYLLNSSFGDSFYRVPSYVNGSLEECFCDFIWGSWDCLKDRLGTISVFQRWVIFGTDMVDLFGPTLQLDGMVTPWPVIWLTPNVNIGYVVAHSENRRYAFDVEKISDREACRKLINMASDLAKDGCSVTVLGRTNRLAVKTALVVPTNKKIIADAMNIVGVPMLENSWIVNNTVFRAF